MLVIFCVQLLFLLVNTTNRLPRVSVTTRFVRGSCVHAWWTFSVSALISTQDVIVSNFLLLPLIGWLLYKWPRGVLVTSVCAYMRTYVCWMAAWITECGINQIMILNSVVVGYLFVFCFLNLYIYFVMLTMESFARLHWYITSSVIYNY